MKTSLNKLNRIISKLKEQAKRQTLSPSFVSNTFSSTSFKDDIVTDLVARKAEADQLISRYCDVHQDIAALVRLKRKANEACGVSVILDSIELNKKLIEHARGLDPDGGGGIYGTGSVFDVETVDRHVALALAAVSRGETNPLADRYNPTQMTVGVRLYNKAEIDARITALQRGINKLEDELLELNAETKVEFELTQTSKDLIGIIPD